MTNNLKYQIHASNNKVECLTNSFELQVGRQYFIFGVNFNNILCILGFLLTHVESAKDFT